MDILEQYDKENHNPKESLRGTYGDSMGDYGPIVSFVMRISRGKIQSEPQANFVLLIIAGIMAGVAIMLFVSATGGGGGTPLPYEQTYRPVQSDL